MVDFEAENNQHIETENACVTVAKQAHQASSEYECVSLFLHARTFWSMVINSKDCLRTGLGRHHVDESPHRDRSTRARVCVPHLVSSHVRAD